MNDLVGQKTVKKLNIMGHFRSLANDDDIIISHFSGMGNITLDHVRQMRSELDRIAD